MNREEFVSFIAEQANVTKKDAKEWLDIILGSIKQGLLEGNDIKLTGFGKFEIVTKAARSGIMQGQEWSSPEHKAAKFSFTDKELKNID